MQYVSKWSDTGFALFTCKTCKRAARVAVPLADWSIMESIWKGCTEKAAEYGLTANTNNCYVWRQCECGTFTVGKRVLGKDSGTIKVCNAKCMSATGPSCDCPCKGENHGGKFAA